MVRFFFSSLFFLSCLWNPCLTFQKNTFVIQFVVLLILASFFYYYLFGFRCFLKFSFFYFFFSHFIEFDFSYPTWPLYFCLLYLCILYFLLFFFSISSLGIFLHLVFNPFFVLIIFIAIVLSFSWFVFFFFNFIPSTFNLILFLSSFGLHSFN